MAHESKSGSVPVQNAICPRCGYDLRGVVATWTDACPMNGVCAECGLRFWWGDLIHPSVQGPAWCAEYFRTSSEVADRFVKTMFMTLCPRRFWSDLAMHHQFRAARVLGFLFALFGSSILVCGCMCFPSALLGGISGYSGIASPLIPIAVTLQLLVPFVFLMLPVSMRQAKVRASHLARITLYGLTWTWGFAAAIIIVEVVVIVNRYLMASLHTGLLLDRLIGAWMIMLPVALWWWWTSAIQYHLKLTHASGVAAAVLSIAILLPTTIGLLLPGVNIALAMWIDDLVHQLL